LLIVELIHSSATDPQQYETMQGFHNSEATPMIHKGPAALA
jgi:hypothetical protein